MISKIKYTVINEQYEYFCNTYIHERSQDIGKLTLFTPSYNRDKFLPRLYENLLSQTSSNFIWVIVNDGSSDNTDEVVRNIVNENKIPILYIDKENGGKHSAFKVALDNCITEYFQCLDDDDLYDGNAVETFLNTWQQIKAEGIKDIGAIRALSRRKDGSIISDKPSEINLGSTEDLSTLEMNYIRKNHMENWTCYRTEALRAVELFPENYWLADQHTFFSEGIWQSRFARKYKCRYLYTPLRTYTDDSEVSLIRAKKTRQYYMNMFINNKFKLDEQHDFLVKDTKEYLKTIVLMQLLRGYLNLPLGKLISTSSNIKTKFLFLISSPLSPLGKKMINNKIQSIKS